MNLITIDTLNLVTVWTVRQLYFNTDFRRCLYCAIYLFYTLMNHWSIEKQTLRYLFTAIMIAVRFIKYAIPLYYQWDELKILNDGIGGTIANVKTYSITDWIYFMYYVPLWVFVHLRSWFWFAINIYIDYYNISCIIAYAYGLHGDWIQ